MKKSLLLCVLLTCFAFAQDVRNVEIQQVVQPGDVVFAVKDGLQQSTDITHLNSVLTPSLGSFDSSNTQKLFTYQENGQSVTLFVRKLHQRMTVEQAIQELTTNRSSVVWASPNYSYQGDPREGFTSDDPQIAEQFHHQVMNNQEAWESYQGNRNIIVAVTDDGVDIDHVDLRASIWINQGEIPGNGIDDDSNGFVDDFNGWDFSSNDNDPRPNGGSHGTHVAGIIAAEINNGVGISGTAPGVTVMPIRFYGSGAWSSTVVANSYKYAVENGARIISTSFNIDRFVNDPTYRASLRYLYQNGVLLFNSGGNGYRLNPPRQAFHELLLVGSTIADNKANDEKSAYSNWGTGTDLCAPGGGGSAGILSTVPGDKYSRKSGTSMAAPNAAAVAALIWSIHPEWSKEQVAAKLYASCDNIDNVNGKFANLLGAGRINTLKAVSSQIDPPKIRVIRELENATRLRNIEELTLSFITLFSQDSAENPSSYELVRLEDQSNITVNSISEYLIGSNEVILGFEKLTPGQYRFTAKASKLEDPFGNKPLNDYVVEFTVLD